MDKLERQYEDIVSNNGGAPRVEVEKLNVETYEDNTDHQAAAFDKELQAAINVRSSQVSKKSHKSQRSQKSETSRRSRQGAMIQPTESAQELDTQAMVNMGATGMPQSHAATA